MKKFLGLKTNNCLFFQINSKFLSSFACGGLLLFVANSALAEEDEVLIADNSPHLLGAVDSYWKGDAFDEQSSAPASHQKVFAGIEVNQQEVAVLDLIKSADDYLLPIKEIFPLIQASYQVHSGDLDIIVPSGKVQILARDTFRIGGEIWVSLKVLNAHLLFNGIFNESKFALQIQPPWNTAGLGESVDYKQSKELLIDHYPDSFSLRQIRLTHEVRNQENNNSHYSELVTSGAALNGSWRFEAEQSDAKDWTASDYFWLSRDDNSQWLVGLQTISPSVIAPAVTLTGGQYFYSNRSIPYDSYQDISQSGFFRQLGNSIQRIQGRAEAGSIAQLNIDGQLIAEKFVQLDGSYNFDEVQLNSSSFTEIEVLILDAVSRVVLERQDKTRANADYLLEDGQLVASAALGVKGNVLDPEYQSNGEAGMLLYRYGLNENATIEAGYLLDEGENAAGSTATFGFASALGKNFVAAARLAQRNSALANQFELNGYGKKWRLSTYWRSQQAGYDGSDATLGDNLTSANLNYYYQYTPYLRWELIGRYNNGNSPVEFLKPGVFYSPNHQLSLGLRPDSKGDYRGELFYKFNQDMRLRSNFNQQEQNTRFDWQYSDNISSYGAIRHFEPFESEQELNQKSITELSVGGYWRPDDWNAYHHLRLEFNYSQEYGAGGFVEYRNQLASGVYFDLQVRSNDSQADGDLSAFARISFDFATAGGRFVAARNRSSYNTDGSIAGRLMTDSGQCEIDNISLLINGVAHKVPVQGCDFYLERIKPGIHRVRLVNEFLPIELIPDSKSYIAQVAPSAVTQMDFTLNAEYSAAGKVSDMAGKAITSANVSVYNSEGKLMLEVMSDQFGYYRIDGLSNGNYQVVAKDAMGTMSLPVDFKIENDFLFDLNLSIIL